MSLKEKMSTTFGCTFALLFIAYGLVQVFAGYIGISEKWGTGWAIAALAGCFVFRLSLPLTIGAFFAARDIWGWHWGLALLFAAPGLAFMALMVPGVVASLFGKSAR
jgi:hypothetical protein